MNRRLNVHAWGEQHHENSRSWGAQSEQPRDIKVYLLILAWSIF